MRRCSAPPRTPRSNRVRTAVAIGIGVISSAAGLAGIAKYFGERILTPARKPDERVSVWAIDTLPRSGENTESTPQLRVWLEGPDAALEGNYSFIFDNRTGHARVGPVVDQVTHGGRTRVARDVIGIDRGDLRVGSRGRVTGWWYTTPEELGYLTEHVSIPVNGGSLTGWLITPPDPVAGRWAIHVHGRGALPEETLRGVPPVARAGVTSLVIQYRNDPAAPRGIRGKYGLGLAEREDVDVALRWCLARGAQRVTLIGWSMGGTISLLTATRGAYRGWIDGLVLDTPGVDWPDILRTQAKLARAPKLLGDLGRWAIQHSLVRGAVPEHSGTDVNSLNPGRFAAGLTQPVLIHAGPGDTFVPWDGAQELERLAPHLVRIRTAAGEHVKIWNVDPHGWEAETQAFVAALPDPPGMLHRASPNTHNIVTG